MKKILIFTMIILLATLVSAGTVTRSFSSDTVEPGETVDVTLTVAVESDDSFYAIDETYPAGWTLLDNGGLSQAGTRLLRALVFSGLESRTYVYQLRAPTSATSSTFSGTYSFDTSATPNIAGSTTLTVQAVNAQSEDNQQQSQSQTLQTDKVDYDRGEIVNIEVNFCSVASAIEIYNAKTPFPDLVYLAHGEGSWQQTYSTLSDSSSGEYTIRASCEDGTSETAEFCVDQNDCTEITPSGEGEAEGESGSSGGSSGGGTRRFADFRCGTWSTCDATGMQTRECIDRKGIRKPKNETQTCQCQESWQCRDWSRCNNGQQTRTCTEINACGTSLLKPKTTQSCKTAGGIKQTVKKIFKPEPTPGKTGFAKFWEDYGIISLAILAAILLTLLIIWMLHRKHGKKKAYNFNELKQWIQAERKMGTSNVDIKHILMEKTGWNQEEIHKAFESLRNSTVDTVRKVPSNNLKQ
jgi:hypothetical protein